MSTLWGIVHNNMYDIDIFDLLTDESKESVMKQLKEAKEQAKKDGLAEGRAEGRAEGHADGLAEGRAKGIAEGKKAGIAEALLESAKRMIKKGIYSLEEIAENLDLPLNEVQALSAQMT